MEKKFIEDINSPEVRIFAALTERELAAKCGLFIAESPKVIASALDCGMEPVAFLCEERHIEGDAREVLARAPGATLYTGTRDTLSALTGYTLTRGVLCAMRRPQLPTLEEVARGASRLAVIDGVCDTTNIGAIFRSAIALGIDGVLLTRGRCDPLNRRSIRVSMGTVFRVPWTWIDRPADAREVGFKVAALALGDDSVPLDHPPLKEEPRLALVRGTEGDGLSRRVIDDADYVVRIPMSRGVDSLNVAAASAVAFWELRNKH